jgi:hypothetical protein
LVSSGQPHVRPIKRGKASAATEFGAKISASLVYGFAFVDRIPIEGKFGQAKRRFSLSKIMCKLARTSETAIAVTFIVLNIERWLKALSISGCDTSIQGRGMSIKSSLILQTGAF